MSDKEKKYPWIKAVFQRKKQRNKAIECVYAGPEMMGRVYAGPKAPEVPEKPYTPEMPVYAGPEYFGSVPKTPPVQAVYAAPVKIKDDKARMQGVYAGPSFMPRGRAEMEDVYAGPEYFGAPDEEPAEELPEPCEEPESPAVKTSDPLTMFVYAGPEYFNSRKENGGFAPAPEAPAEPADYGPLKPGTVRCDRCGAVVSASSSFCHECGNVMVKEV